MIPEDLKYAETHEWARITDIVEVGLTDYAIEQLGDIVFVELPAVGDPVTANNPFAVVESVKAVSDIHSPVTGTVTEINEQILDNYDIFKSAAFTDAWLVKIQPADLTETEALMTPDQYSDHISS